jgi:hypothetical protein
MVQAKLKKTQRTKRSQKEGPKIHEVTAEFEQQYLKKPRYDYYEMFKSSCC